MKSELHPEYVVAHVRCTCGNEFATRATRSDYHLEICSQCHPFYTGRQKLVDTGGRVERFQRRVAKGRMSSAGAARPRQGAAVGGGTTSSTSARGGDGESAGTEQQAGAEQQEAGAAQQEPGAEQQEAGAEQQEAGAE